MKDFDIPVYIPVIKELYHATISIYYTKLIFIDMIEFQTK